MHFSPIFKASQQCAASPDGRLIAALLSSTIVVRSTETLQTIHVVKLPSDLSGSVQTLLWAPSSTRVLISTASQIHVLSALDASFHATVRNPVSGAGKPSHIRFGNDDKELLVFSSFGLKLLIFNLSSSKASEIGSPKFHLPSSASRCFSLRPATGHLALLTRVGGRDIVSVHSPDTRQLQRSWSPETIDAQALAWSPNGQWLLLWESPAHGWRLLLYTPDGQLFRTLGEAGNPGEEDEKLNPGIRNCQFSPDALSLAVGDYSRTVIILDTVTWRQSLGLAHPSTISPSGTLQVWQEQLHDPKSGWQTSRSFHRATQQISPPAPTADAKSSGDPKLGCSAASFDASSNLVATRLDDSPTTIWIWDLAAAELRAVLLFHSPVEFYWHPKIRELLLVTCQEEPLRSVPFIWDPLSDGPKCIHVGQDFPGGQASGRLQATWISQDSETATILLSDSQHSRLVLLSESEAAPVHWQLDNTSDQLGPGSARSTWDFMRDGVGNLHEGLDDTSLLEDTFSFKRG